MNETPAPAFRDLTPDELTQTGARSYEPVYLDCLCGAERTRLYLQLSIDAGLVEDRQDDCTACGRSYRLVIQVAE